LVIEPGRFIVAESGVLLCTVNTVKQTPAHKFVGVDTGFHHLIRPAMYGSYHPIVVVDSCSNKGTRFGSRPYQPCEKVAVCGNVCESGDVFTRDEKGIVDRELPQIKEGAVLAILVAGAYGFSMASNYNTRPRPAEVLIREKGIRVKMIRKREALSQVIYGM
ncbi:MAG: diaminopimelate decarboxylase, partial [Nanoarchaeota archaeon]